MITLMGYLRLFKCLQIYFYTVGMNENQRIPEDIHDSLSQVY